MALTVKMPPRYRSNTGRFISNRAGRRALWQKLASGRVALRRTASRMAVRRLLAKRAVAGFGARTAARAVASGAGRSLTRFIPYVGAALTAADLGYTAYKYFKERNRKRGKVYGPGRLAGVNSYKRVAPSEKQNRTALNNAYQLSVEKSGTQTPSIAGIIGHSSISRTYALRCLMGALLRLILYRNGIKANSPTQNVTPMVTGTVIGIEFQYAGATNDGFSITITAPITFSQILDAFINGLNAKYDALSATLVPYDIRFRNIYITSPAVNNAPNTTTIDLINAKIQMWCMSSLKVQNRSLNSAGDDDIHDVDQVPLKVVNYSGYGTGLDSRYDFLGLGFNANQDCIIAASDPPLAGDAPLPSLLQGVRKYGYSDINPGDIKTDILKNNIYVSLDTLTRTIIGPRGNGNLRLPLGKYAFMHYEKTIEANNASPVAMSIAYENQLYISSKIILRANDLPIPEFIRS